MRRGFTLHEMLISLGVMSAVVALAVQLAVGQLRFFRGIGEMESVRGQIGQATATVASVLWEISVPAGDIVAALDSAIELRAAVGTAVVCGSSAGSVTIPVPIPAGNTLAAFVDAPQPDDRVAALFADSVGATWLTFRVATAPRAGGGCSAFSSATSSWTLDLADQVAIPAGTILRFTRPLRLSLYRASDNRWYLGARDWNATARRFNSIQPVAGPLGAFNATSGLTGLQFTFFDASGAILPEGSDPLRIRRVGIVARGASLRDSISMFVGLRNAR